MQFSLSIAHTCCSSSMTLLANSNTRSFCWTTAAIIKHSPQIHMRKLPNRFEYQAAETSEQSA